MVQFSSGFESSEEIKHCRARIPQREEKYKELKGKVQWQVLRWPQDKWEKLGREKASANFQGPGKGHISEGRDIRAIMNGSFEQ